MLLHSEIRGVEDFDAVVLTGGSDFLDRLNAGEDASDMVAAVTIPGLPQAAADKMIRAELAQASGGTIAIDDAACATIYRETNGVPARIGEITARIAAAAEAAGSSQASRPYGICARLRTASATAGDGGATAGRGV